MVKTFCCSCEEMWFKFDLIKKYDFLKKLATHIVTIRLA